MMEVKLFVMEVGDKYYVSGTIYTPNGIESYDAIFDSFEPIYFIRPTFATRIVVAPSTSKIKSHYYLTYSNIEDLKKMLSFMVGSSAEYLSFIPIDVIEELGIQLDKSKISFSPVHIPLSQSVPCNIIGSIYTPVVVSNNKIYLNNVQIGSISEKNEVYICGHKGVLVKDLETTLKLDIRKMILCYLRETHKYFITWSDILKMWCGIRILLMT
jgi:hypothetical protein